MNVPNHVAIILDGNGRWAKAKGMPRNYGHVQGAKTVEVICEEAYRMGIQYLTVYAFSTENWKRSAEEVTGIMKLLRRYLEEALRDMEKNRVKFRFFGDLTRLSPELQALCHDAESRSEEYDVQVNFCLNYGGRDEIVAAARKAAAAGEITKETLSAHLYTAGMPDPDLIIRTSGELRVSNFLLWQSAYSEYYFTPTLWPDFGREALCRALWDYSARKRRFGRA